MQLNWSAFPPDGTTVEVAGFLFPLEEPPAPGYGLLRAQPACCAGCIPGPETTLEILADTALPGAGEVRLAGTFRRLPGYRADGWRYRLEDARRLPGPPPAGPWVSRRKLLAGLPLACTAAVAGCAAELSPAEQHSAQELVAQLQPMDLHSHAGRVILPTRSLSGFDPVAAPMRQGGMALIALAMVADQPIITFTNRLRPGRSPASGELYGYSQDAFARLHSLVRQEGLALVTDQAGLADVLARRVPAVVVAAEGADFLEGRLERVEEAFTRHRLRHLQLTHYRSNELGDIQTEPPIHGGNLTPFGAEVVRACNRLGILVDVAHAPAPMVRQVAQASGKPIVLSHTSLERTPSAWTRRITPDHARVVAETGGVIGVWPVAYWFPTITAYAEGIARMAEVVGVAHVGVGSDLYGIPGGASFNSYTQTPALALALRARGFSLEEVAQLMGGNQARVLRAVLPAA